MARIAEDDHPDITLSSGDRVIFSSRTIPGNENSVNRILNALTRAGVEVVTDRDRLVHVSGHPRRTEMAQMYAWTRPTIAVPAHGEDLHLAEHARFARAQGVGQVVRARNGTLVRLAPGKAEIVDHVRTGRLYRDGDLIVPSDDRALPERRKLAVAGLVSVAIALDRRGVIVGRPRIEQIGIPENSRAGESLADLLDDVVERVLSSLSSGKKRDPEAIEQAVDRAIRGELRNVWGKKPACHVMVIEV